MLPRVYRGESVLQLVGGVPGSWEAGKSRLACDTSRQATAPEVKELRSEAAVLQTRLPLNCT